MNARSILLALACGASGLVCGGAGTLVALYKRPPARTPVASAESLVAKRFQTTTSSIETWMSWNWDDDSHSVNIHNGHPTVLRLHGNGPLPDSNSDALFGAFKAQVRQLVQEAGGTIEERPAVVRVSTISLANGAGVPLRQIFQELTYRAGPRAGMIRCLMVATGDQASAILDLNETTVPQRPAAGDAGP